MTTTDPSVTAEEFARMPTVESYLRRDREPAPPAILLERSTEDLGNARIPKETYTSREIHEREKRLLWKKAWLMACRENDIPRVGDQVPFDIVGQSVLLIRSEKGLRAFHNTCQHRGNKLVTEPTSASGVRCSFHGWSWNLDGSIRSVPCRWDYPGMTDQEIRLPEVRVATWNGFVFINFDPDAAPLEDFLGEEVLRHWEHWDRTRAWKAAHIGKVVPCNWKLTLEAFLEVYHTVATHPEALFGSGDCNTQYDMYGLHQRLITAMGVPSPHLGDVPAQDVVDNLLGDTGASSMFGEEVELPQVGDDGNARQAVADFTRAGLGARTGVDFSGVSDSEMVDIIQYFVFPNFQPWGGYSYPMAYRVRPNGDDHRSSIFEMMLLVPVADDAELPRDAPLRMTDPELPWGAEAELGGFGPVADQDMFNLKKIQAGVESDGFSGMRYSNVQERNVRNFHRNLARYLDG
ncbi:MAG TPA: aromatic ring-hydroxylating dioxygenase subunit alpha [Pseudonocardia sp.]|jgi:nitrite reductase/ring-hydroxylating ferredoxin subunit|nr:aromatic ring-hydroxylating dioxygenase subunit alpha [Pseudonocardia sp.]